MLPKLEKPALDLDLYRKLIGVDLLSSFWCVRQVLPNVKFCGFFQYGWTIVLLSFLFTWDLG